MKASSLFLLFASLGLSQAVQYSTTLIINNPPPGNYDPNFISHSKIFVTGTTYTDSTASVPCPSAAQIVLPSTSACVTYPSSNNIIAFWLIPGNYSFTVQLPAGQFLGPFPFVASGTFPTPQFPQSIFVITVSQLPAASSANKNFVYLITDGTSGSDCSVGGGSTRTWCVSNGTSWSSMGGGGSSGVSSFNTRTGAVTSQTGDYTAAQVTNAVSTLGSYPNPAWITALAATKLTGNLSISNFNSGSGASSSTFWRGDGVWSTILGVTSFNTRTGAVVLNSGDIVGALGYTPANVALNLSDLSSASTARSNLGLGALAVLSVLPNPSASTLGGIESITSVTHKWINSISTSGVPSQTQPSCGDLSDSGSLCTASSAAPSGSAGGDLGGTYPNPTVIKISSVPFCSGFSPTNGQVLEYTTGGSPNPCYAAATPSAGGVTSFNTRTGAISLTSGDVTTALTFTPANIASPTFTGTPAAPTPSTSDNTTKIATTAFVNNEITNSFTGCTFITGALTCPGSITSGTGSGVSGALNLTQGTLPSSFPANAFSLFAPTSITTSYQLTVPVADSCCFIRNPGSGTPEQLSFVGETGTGSVVRATAPVIGLVNATGLPPAGIAAIGADNVIINPTASSAIPTTQAIPPCASDGTHGLTYSSHTITCTSITGTGGSGSGNAITQLTPALANANSTSDQQLMELTLGAGYLNSLGQPFLINGAFIYTTQSGQTPTITIKAKLCTVSGCGSGTVITLGSIVTTATIAAVTNNNINLNLMSYVTTVGSSGNLEVHGPLSADLGALTTTADSIFNDTNTSVSSNIDLTLALFIDFTVAFSTQPTTPFNQITQRSGGIMPFAATAAPVTSIFGQTGSVGAVGDLSAVGKVVGINSVPLCSGFSPTAGQVITYTTGGSPNPCYNAVTSGGGVVLGTSFISTQESTTSVCSTAYVDMTTPDSVTFTLTATTSVAASYTYLGTYNQVDYSVNNQFNVDGSLVAATKAQCDQPGINFSTPCIGSYKGSLGAGSHTIKVQHCSIDSGGTLKVSNRLLVVMSTP